MKVLHLSSEKTWRGGEQQIAYLIEEQRLSGIDVVVAAKESSEFSKYCEVQQFEYYTYRYKNSLDFKTARGLKKLIAQTKPDLIHVHSSRSHGIIALVHLIGGLNVSVILSRRVDFRLKKSGFSNWKYNLPQIKRILCVSDEIRNMVRDDIKNPERAITVYSGVDLSKFESAQHSDYLRTTYNLSNDAILIGNTSAIADHKDYFTFVDAAQHFLASKKQDICFFIIGDGPLRAQIASYIKEKSLESRIILTGFLTNIPEILQELDIFLMTSKTEGLGTSILDAFASKLAVVSTNGGGLKETVLDEQTGLSSAVGDAQHLASQLERMVTDVALREQLVGNAYEFVQQFSKENTARNTLDIYKEVLA